MKIKILSEFSLHEIYESFKEAFENYVIPLDFNEETTLKRWELAGLDFKKSYGVVDSNKIVAFVFQLSCKDHLYNFATGVVPSHRGQHLIEKIYREIEKEILSPTELSLEVIRENTKALNLYEKLNFKIDRELVSWRGKLIIETETDKNLIYDLRPLEYTDEMNSIRLARPGFENSPCCTLVHPAMHEVHMLRDQEKLLAYAVFTPYNLSLKEIGAADSIEENLDQLFLNMKLDNENLRLMNIDSKAASLQKYWHDRGLTDFVTQYEMTKHYSPI